jgi:O-antigen/teichoic acid export membrane protein
LAQGYLTEVTAPQSATSATRLIRSATWGVVSQASGIPLALLLTPITLRLLGQEAFGVWATVSVLLAYTGLVEFGVRVPLIKQIAEAWSRRDTDAINRLFANAFLFYLVAGGMVAFVIGITSEWIVRAVLHEQMHVEYYRWLVVVAAASFVVNLAFTTLGAVLTGIQRIDIDSQLTIAGRYLAGIASIALLVAGYGLWAMLLSTLTVSLASNAVYYVVCRRLGVPLSLNLVRWFDFMLLRSTLRFSSQVQVAKLATFLDDQFGKALLAFFIGPYQLAYYSIADRLFGRLRTFPASLVAPLMPAAADLNAAAEENRLRRLYLRSLKYVTICAAPSFVGGAVLTVVFIPAWLGPGFQKSVITAVVVLLAYLVWLTTWPGSSFLIAKGQPRYEMYAAILRVAMHLGLTVVLVIRFGYYGAVAAVALAIVVPNMYFHYRIHKGLEISWRETFGQALGVPIGAAAAAGLLVAALEALTGPVNLAVVFGFGLVYGVAFLVLLLLFRGVDSYDRRVLADHVPSRFRRLVLSIGTLGP